MGRRENILNAAASLFATEGYDAVGMDELGAKAGVTGPAIYYYFESKTQLLAQLLLPTSRGLSEDARHIASDSANPLDALERLIDAHLAFVETHPQLAIIHSRELHKMDRDDQAEVRQLMRDYLGTWVTVVKSASPLLEPEGARILTQGVFAMINGIPLVNRRALIGERLEVVRHMTYGLIGSLVPALAYKLAVPEAH